METLSFEQALLEACKKQQDEKEYKELIKSLRPLVTPQPAFNFANIHLIQESIKGANICQQFN